ncbi:MAG: YeeE/YedE family protein, partial [Gammaproteobacteria bacterium]
MNNFTPVSSLFGGALIGIAVVLLLLFNGRTAGVSGIMNGLFFSPKTEMVWRLSFLSGLIVGAYLFARFNPGLFSPRTGYPLWLLACGGFLVGVG